MKHWRKYTVTYLLRDGTRKVMTTFGESQRRVETSVIESQDGLHANEIRVRRVLEIESWRQKREQ